MKLFLRSLMALFAVLMLTFACACAKPQAADTPQDTPTPAPTATSAAELPNPVHEVESYSALLEINPQNMLHDAPEGATDVSYSYIDGTSLISQILFTLDGNEYTYRAAAVNEAAQTDISGVYYDFDQLEENVTAGGQYTLRYLTGDTLGLATWYYTPTKCQYSLFTPTGCDGAHTDGHAIEEVVDVLLPITSDAAGNPLAAAASTPLPVVEVGKVTGTVAAIQSNTVTVTVDSGTLQFLLSGIGNVDANVGDVVEVTYSGNVLDAPEAISIVVLSAAPAEAAVSVTGTVLQYTAQSVFVETTSGSVFGFVIDATTAFKGQSNTLKTGNTVTVSYTGELDNAPLASVIETTAVSAKPEAAAPSTEKNPVNKKLSGTVTSLTTKRVTVYTDSGHSYTFVRTHSTVVTGDYMLEYGCRIRVLYDGYASDGPDAKRITVLAPPDPTPPDPTPYSPTVRTVSGVITMTAGNALVIDSDSGAEYSFLLRSPSISGSLVVGYRATVTYQIEADGTLNATRIVCSLPIVYGPGPVLEDTNVY